jgi:sulfite exporter TauE/SafE
VLSLDPPLPFRWSYSVMQGGSALVGWALGAAFGVGTAMVIFLLGPAVDLLSARVRTFDVHASGRHVTPGVACET